MPIEAHLNRAWVIKLLLIAAMLLAFGTACIVDGAWRYPAQRERYLTYQDYVQADDLQGWAARAEAEGWPTEPTARSELDIYSQWIFLAITWPLGFLAVGMVVRNWGRKIVATEDALIAHSGEKVLYDAITAIDKERWDSKGIAWVHYEEDGEERRIKIDDWVFRDAWKVLDEVEDQTGLGESVPG